MWVLWPVSGKEGWEKHQSDLPASAILKLLYLNMAFFNMPRCHILGQYILNPINTQQKQVYPCLGCMSVCMCIYSNLSKWHKSSGCPFFWCPCIRGLGFPRGQGWSSSHGWETVFLEYCWVVVFFLWLIWLCSCREGNGIAILGSGSLLMSYFPSYIFTTSWPEMTFVLG